MGFKNVFQYTALIKLMISATSTDSNENDKNISSTFKNSMESNQEEMKNLNEDYSNNLNTDTSNHKKNIREIIEEAQKKATEEIKMLDDEIDRQIETENARFAKEFEEFEARKAEIDNSEDGEYHCSNSMFG